MKYLLEQLRERPRIGVGILLTFHFFGIVGLFTPFREWFISLTWFNLLVSFGIILLYHPHWDKRLLYFFIAAYFIGYFAEYLGVNYGLIFGEYIYGKPLGILVGGVPLIIGLNWFIVIYCSYHLAEKLNPKWHFTLISTAVFAVLLDFLIEPVAISLDYWQWEGNQIPLSNYMGWFVISLLLAVIFRLLQVKTNNPIALWLLLIQACFFLLAQLFFVY